MIGELQMRARYADLDGGDAINGIASEEGLSVSPTSMAVEDEYTATTTEPSASYASLIEASSADTNGTGSVVGGTYEVDLLSSTIANLNYDTYNGPLVINQH